MATLNQIICARNLRNTGFGECILDWGKIVTAIRVPKNKVFTQSELDALQATLAAARLAANKSNRIYPIHGFQAITDNSEDTIYQTLGYGAQVPIRDGNYRWTFQYIDGAMCLTFALRSMNFSGTTYWLLGDDQDRLFGYKKKISTGVYGMGGTPLLFHANKPKAPDGANAAAYTVFMDINPKFLIDNMAFVQADFPLSEITGLQDIALKQTGASAAGVFKIQALTGCDGTNLYDLYSAELASAALWIATNVVTGNAITITSVVVDANAKAFTVTLDDEDADYPATSAGLIDVSLVNPTLLDAADISGFESNTVQVLRG